MTDFLLPVYKRLPVEFIKGEGVYLFDIKGKKYLDFLAGIAVNVLGYAHPVFLKAVEDFLKNGHPFHVSNLFEISFQRELAEKLTVRQKFDGLAFFCNSGAEAIEAALKIVKKWANLNGKKKILALKGSFHGRTCGALSLTGQSKYQAPFVPLLPDVEFVEFNNIEDLTAKFDDSVAGIFLEVVQGEGGVRPLSLEFLTTVRELCDEKGALLVFDEIQTGIGRTGCFYAWQGVSVTPDIFTLAKGLGGGLPIGATLVKREFSDVLSAGDHASTFGGNPFVCFVSSKVVDFVARDDFLKKVRELSTELFEKLQRIDSVKFVRGKGLLIGFSVGHNPDDVIKKCLEAGLIIGKASDVLRIAPPLVVEKEHIDEFVDKLRWALSKL